MIKAEGSSMASKNSFSSSSSLASPFPESLDPEDQRVKLDERVQNTCSTPYYRAIAVSSFRPRPHENNFFIKTQKSFAFGPTVQTDPAFSLPEKHTYLKPCPRVDKKIKGPIKHGPM